MNRLLATAESLKKPKVWHIVLLGLCWQRFLHICHFQKREPMTAGILAPIARVLIRLQFFLCEERVLDQLNLVDFCLARSLGLSFIDRLGRRLDYRLVYFDFLFFTLGSF